MEVYISKTTLKNNLELFSKYEPADEERFFLKI